MKRQLLHAGPVLAVLAVLATLAALPAQAQGVQFGRLFTTPAERLQLDSRRESNPGAVPGAGGAIGLQQQQLLPQAQLAPPPPPEPVQLDGVVRRSNGRSTLWLNQLPQADGSSEVLPDQSVALRLSSGRKLIMKPGQRFNPADGSVHEAAGR